MFDYNYGHDYYREMYACFVVVCSVTFRQSRKQEGENCEKRVKSKKLFSVYFYEAMKGREETLNYSANKHGKVEKYEEKGEKCHNKTRNKKHTKVHMTLPIIDVRQVHVHRTFLETLNACLCIYACFVFCPHEHFQYFCNNNVCT